MISTDVEPFYFLFYFPTDTEGQIWMSVFAGVHRCPFCVQSASLLTVVYHRFSCEVVGVAIEIASSFMTANILGKNKMVALVHT